jgi:MarR family 2-MHQ and catechol resistance regulon transcriptional repressor
MGTHYAGQPAEVRALNAYIKLMRCADSVQRQLERRLGRLGLTDNQFGVLEALLHLGPLAQHELGRALFTSRANITTVVDNLEKRSLVRRERDGADRRYVTVYLTPDGRELIQTIFPGQAQAITEAFSALSPAEQDALGRLCKKLGLAQQAPGGVARPAGAESPQSGRHA